MGVGGKGRVAPAPCWKRFWFCRCKVVGSALGCSREARGSWSVTCVQISISMEQKEKILGPSPAPGTQVPTLLGGRCGLTLPCQGMRVWQWEPF